MATPLQISVIIQQISKIGGNNMKAFRAVSITYDKIGRKITCIFKGLTAKPFQFCFECEMVELGVNRIMNIENTSHLQKFDASGTQTRWVTQEKHNDTIDAPLTTRSKLLRYTKVNATDTEISIEGISSDISAISNASCVVIELNA